MKIITHGLDYYQHLHDIIGRSAYTRMQLEYYQGKAANWSTDKRNFVVGLFDEHNESSIYDVMLERFDTSNMKMLDFGCGPGRNIVKLSDKFKEIDGVDIAPRNLENAKLWIETNEEKFRPDQTINLYECNGTDLRLIEDATYDMVYSTIVLQHIPIHELRLRYFKEFLRVLTNPCTFFYMFSHV